ncbi:hypothetical protein I79_015594 [Cricetulus griseus]|uniref:Peptidase A2 domain-containing protein n=1 Tax=Cricetulus griseus TaxID=10029 RepID=G3HX75_CRIGR|nr:hypothetical protein I79_015594 [Cricetulus griseus]
MTHTEGYRLLDCVEDVVRAGTGPMNVDRPETCKETCYNQETEEPLEGHHIEKGLIIPSHYGGQSFTGQIDDMLPIEKSDTTLYGSLASNEESNMTGGDDKRIFWQTSLNDKRPQLKVRINNKIITGLVDTGADVIIITQ